MLSDMLVEDRFHHVSIDPKLGCDERSDARRQLHPGIALSPRQREDGRGRLCPVDQLAFELAEPQAPLLRLDDFVRRAR
jgi:hypothetical protein